MSRWSRLLEAEERLVWQGRPAPRAFTFRNWRWSLTAVVGLASLAFVCQKGWSFSFDRVGIQWCAWAGLVVGLWAAVGHLIWARLEWEQVFYVLTDRRLVAVSGILGRRCRVFPLAELEQVEPRFMGAALATVKVAGGGRRLTLHCLEHPQLLLKPLSSLAKGTLRRGAEPAVLAEDI